MTVATAYKVRRRGRSDGSSHDATMCWGNGGQNRRYNTQTNNRMQARKHTTTATHKHTTTTTHTNTHLCQCLATEIVIAHSQCGAAILPKSGHGQSYKRLSHIDQRHAGVRHQQASGKLLGLRTHPQHHHCSFMEHHHNSQQACNAGSNLPRRRRVVYEQTHRQLSATDNTY